MTKVTRKIIKIDESKCDGCGQCIPSCPEGALQIIDGKARLVKDSFCDGLGACLGECPTGALTIEEREAEEFDEAAATQAQHQEQHHHHTSACPGAQTQQWETHGHPHAEAKPAASELGQWPVQIHLVSPSAPYFQDAELVLAADCVPFAYGNFHADFIKGRALAVGCPKLDDTNAYIEKITDILKQSSVKGITVVQMEVPCCHGMTHIAKEAIKKSGKDIPLKTVTIGLKGDIIASTPAGQGTD